MRRLLTTSALPLFLLSLFVGTTIVACGGEGKPGEKNDTTATSDSAAAAAAKSAEVDQAIAKFMVAADSLATLLERVKTVAEVEASEAKIKEWSGALTNFQNQSARYGDVLVERMGAAGADPAVMRLADARMALQEKHPDVYARIAQIENGGKGAEAKPE